MNEQVRKTLNGAGRADDRPLAYRPALRSPGTPEVLGRMDDR